MIRGDERYWANMVLDVIEHVECPMLMYEGEKMIVRKALKAYLEDCKTEPTCSKMEQVEDEPMKTTDYCDICKRDMCEDCIADATNPYCVPSHYEINYEPKDEPKTQMKTQNSNLTCNSSEKPNNSND